MIFKKKNRTQERKVSFALFAVLLMIVSAFVCIQIGNADVSEASYSGEDGQFVSFSDWYDYVSDHTMPSVEASAFATAKQEIILSSSYTGDYTATTSDGTNDVTLLSNGSTLLIPGDLVSAYPELLNSLISNPLDVVANSSGLSNGTAYVTRDGVQYISVYLVASESTSDDTFAVKIGNDNHIFQIVRMFAAETGSAAELTAGNNISTNWISDNNQTAVYTIQESYNEWMSSAQLDLTISDNAFHVASMPEYSFVLPFTANGGQKVIAVKNASLNTPTNFNGLEGSDGSSELLLNLGSYALFVSGGESSVTLTDAKCPDSNDSSDLCWLLVDLGYGTDCVSLSSTRGAVNTVSIDDELDGDFAFIEVVAYLGDYIDEAEYKSSCVIGIYASYDHYPYNAMFYDSCGGSTVYQYYVAQNGAETEKFEVVSDTSKIPTKEGYTLLGWTDDPTSSAVKYTAGDYVSVGRGTPTVLHAVWKSNTATQYTHTIVYNANSGSGTMANTVVTDTVNGSSSVTIASNSFTRSGYTFLGWATDKNAASAQYQPGSTVSVGANATVTLYAVWDKNTTTSNMTSGSLDPDGKIYMVEGKTISITVSGTANHGTWAGTLSRTGGALSKTSVSNGDTVTFTAPSKVSGMQTYTVTLTSNVTDHESSSYSLTIVVVPTLMFTNTPTADSSTS